MSYLFAPSKLCWDPSFIFLSTCIKARDIPLLLKATGFDTLSLALALSQRNPLGSKVNVRGPEGL